MNKKDSRIGLVGVGLMGHGIARSLLRAGYGLEFLEHEGNQPVEDLVQQGARGVPELAELAGRVDALLLCVTGTPQVEDVVYRSDGLLASLGVGTTVIDCSTAIPASTVKVAADIEAAGGHFMDAAMTRTPREAADGRLNLLVGGDAALVTKWKPLLLAFAENITLAGPVGAGHRIKLVHNFVSLGFAAILAEAGACAGRGGIEAETLVDVLDAGGGKSVALDRLKPALLEGDGSAFQFSLANAAKDLGYYTAMARDRQMVHAVAAAVQGVYERGSEARPDGGVADLLAVCLQQVQE